MHIDKKNLFETWTQYGRMLETQHESRPGGTIKCH